MDGWMLLCRSKHLVVMLYCVMLRCVIRRCALRMCQFNSISINCAVLCYVVFHVSHDREKVARSLLPRLRAFAADLLIFSSGFDAHYDDLYHFLTEEDFHWLTKEIIAACSSPLNSEHVDANTQTKTTAHDNDAMARTGGSDDGSGGGEGGKGSVRGHVGHQCRVVSVLEGGYSLSATVPFQPAKKTLRKGMVAPDEGWRKSG